MSLLLALLGAEPPVELPPQADQAPTGPRIKTRSRVVPGWALPEDPDLARRNAAAAATLRTRRQLRALRLLRLI